MITCCITKQDPVEAPGEGDSRGSGSPTRISQGPRQLNITSDAQSFSVNDWIDKLSSEFDPFLHTTSGAYTKSMEFGPNQKIRFRCDDGAYSTITDDENKKQQITLTDHEARIVRSHFVEPSILRGSVKSNPELAKKEFALYPTGEPVTLKINFPKIEKNELRLYLNTQQFKPEGGLVVFLFPLNEQLWIGAMTESEWRTGSADIIKDESDDVYQQSIAENNDQRIVTLKERDIYFRDRNIALESMENSDYVCEFDNKHELFTSRRTGRSYLEAHHLIPMQFQSEFEANLDIVHNVFCLCPNCHRAVHHAQEETTKDILKSLIQKRNILPEYKITETDLHALYGVEDID